MTFYDANHINQLNWGWGSEHKARLLRFQAGLGEWLAVTLGEAEWLSLEMWWATNIINMNFIVVKTIINHPPKSP